MMMTMTLHVVAATALVSFHWKNPPTCNVTQMSVLKLQLNTNAHCIIYRLKHRIRNIGVTANSHNKNGLHGHELALLWRYKITPRIKKILKTILFLEVLDD